MAQIANKRIGQGISQDKFHVSGGFITPQFPVYRFQSKVTKLVVRLPG